MTNLEKLRKQIDIIDLEILNLLEQRLRVVQKISQTKQQANLSTRSIAREAEILQQWQQRKNLCSENFISKIVKLILKESRQFQKLLLKKTK